MRLLWILLPLLAQDAFGQDMFSVRPKEYQVVRVGQDVTLKCETKVDAMCAWKLTTSTGSDKGFIFSSPFQISQDLSAITPLASGSARNCSFKISNIDDSYNGNYTCAPYIGGGQTSAGNVAVVVVARKPESLRFLGAAADGYPLKVSTSDPTSVQCEVLNARPKAEIVWYLDNTQLYDTIVAIDTPANDPSLWNSVSSLTYQFRKEDFGKSLRCRANHVEYDEQDEYQREHGVEVDVQFAAYRPEGDIGRLYGFTAGEEGEIVVNFTANPRPSVMSWRVGDEVKVAAGGETRDGRFKASVIIERNVARGMYALKLTIDPVEIEDQSKTFVLQLENEIGETELKFQIGTGSAPLPEAVDGGTIGAIVAAVLVLLIIIGVVAFGRSRGKWCFAATSTEARSDRSDTESAHDEKTDKPEKKPVKISTLFSSLLKGNKTDADVEAAENKEETRELTKPDGEADGEAPPQPKKENEVVYAELLLDRDGVKTDVRPSAEKTEYAVIVGTKTEADAAAEDNKTKE